MKSLKNKKIFISGGNGVIGNYLVEKLHRAGAILYVGDLKPRPLNWPENILYRQGDLNYISKSELDVFGPEYFFHLAACFERSAETYEFWDENSWNNLNLSTYLMTLLKDSATLRNVIFASSYLIYDPELYSFDHPVEIPTHLKETDNIYPRNLTGAAKLNHEIELRFINEFRKDHLRTVCARIYRSYGKNSMDIISRWIRELLKGEELILYRKEGIFDYIYADDVAEGLIRLAVSFETGIFNLGRGEGRKVTEVLDVLRSHFPGLQYKEKEVNILWEASQADMNLFYEKTGWRPEYSIEEAIPEIIEHERHKLEEEERKLFHVLVTSVSRKVPMLQSVKLALNKLHPGIRLFAADVNPDCIGRYFADEFWEMPHLDNMVIGKIIEYCKTNDIKLIIPSRDGELLFWAQNKNLLESEGINVMVSGQKEVGFCTDKLEFYKVLHSEGFPVIPTKLNPSELKHNGSYVVKERYGAGANNILINVSEKEALEKTKIMKEPIFQPYIAGKEFSVDVFINKKKKIKGIISRARELVVNGESQITRVEYDNGIEDLLIPLFERFRFYGHVIVQVIKTPDGKYHIIEINCRFGGASTLSIASGLDSFYWILLETYGADIEYYPFIPQYNKVQIRYPKDLVIDGTRF